MHRGAFLSRRSRGFVIVVGLLVMALIGLIDAVTGPFAISIFYLVPIAIVTFSRGRWVGLTFAGLAAVGWSALDVAQHLTSMSQ